MPDNVFFSTDYCASVKDFQCVPKMEESPPVTEATTTVRNVLIAISVVMFVVLTILTVLLIRFCIRSRQNRKVIPVKPVQGYTNDDVAVYDIS